MSTPTGDQAAGPRQAHTVASRLPLVRRLVLVYLALGIATVLALVVVTIVAPDDVTPQAWVRGVIVAGTAFLTLRFAQGAIRREHRALLRLRIVLVVLCVAVVAVLAFLPLPGWMIAEQAVCAAVLLAAAVLAFGEPRAPEGETASDVSGGARR